MSSKAKQQLMFNAAVLGVIGQGGKSINTNGLSCAYRGEKGAKCAVGHLIPDEKYEPIWDSYSNPTLIGETSAKADRLRASIDADWDDIDILSAIQRAHDAADQTNFVPAFTAAATQVANLYGLEMPNAQ